MWRVNRTQLSAYLARYGCSTALYKSQEGSRVSTVSRKSQRSQDTAMSTLFLSAMYRQTRRICKEKVWNGDQMSSLSGLLSDPWRKHVWQPSPIFSSQPIGGSPRFERWQQRSSEMRQLWRKQHGNLLLLCLPELSLRGLFWRSSALEGHKRSSQCFHRKFASARCGGLDAQTRHVCKEISREWTTWLLLSRL